VQILGRILSYIYWILYIYLWYMIIVILISWVPGVIEQGWYQKLRSTIDWYIGRFRGLLVIGPVDLTPILGFILYEGALYCLNLIIRFLT
jgi:uncharacterized protein YggT (Ycf19 family)